MKNKLPNNVTIKRRYERRGRRQQGQLIGKDFKFVKNVAKSPILKQLGNSTLENVPKLYNKGISKIKIKIIKKLFNLIWLILFWTWDQHIRMTN